MLYFIEIYIYRNIYLSRYIISISIYKVGWVVLRVSCREYIWVGQLMIHQVICISYVNRQLPATIYKRPKINFSHWLIWNPLYFSNSSWRNSKSVLSSSDKAYSVDSETFLLNLLKLVSLESSAWFGRSLLLSDCVRVKSGHRSGNIYRNVCLSVTGWRDVIDTVPPLGRLRRKNGDIFSPGPDGRVRGQRGQNWPFVKWIDLDGESFFHVFVLIMDPLYFISN